MILYNYINKNIVTNWLGESAVLDMLMSLFNLFHMLENVKIQLHLFWDLQL